MNCMQGVVDMKNIKLEIPFWQPTVFAPLNQLVTNQMSFRPYLRQGLQMYGRVF